MYERQDGLRWGMFSPQDLEAMRDAFLLAVSDNPPPQRLDEGEALGRVIIRLYRMGLVEPEKLGSVAALMSSSRLFRRAAEGQLQLRF